MTIEDVLNEKYLKEARTRRFFLPAPASQIIYVAIWRLGNDPGATLRPSPYPDWFAWRAKFRELSERADLCEETREGLRRGVAAMDSVAHGRKSCSCTWLCD